MRLLPFLALLALTANAFNFTEYHLGVISVLNLNSTEVEDSMNCVNALETDYENTYSLLKSKNFVNIAKNLGESLVQFQETFSSVCGSYFQAQIQSLEENGNITDLKQAVESNLKQYYPLVIQNIAQWADLITSGQDFSAGYTQSLIMQLLIAGQNGYEWQYTPENSGEIVPFNPEQFFSQFYTALFSMLMIQAKPNVTALVQCYENIETLVIAGFESKDKFAGYDFEEKLNAVQDLVGLGFETIRGCEGIMETEKYLLGPVVEAFEQDPVHFTLEVINNVANDLPTIMSAIPQEILLIQQGQYVAAGNVQGSILFDIFDQLVLFGY